VNLLSEQKSEEAQLSIKDRLNFPYILANQIMTFQKSILAEEYSEREIEEAITGFVHLIPDGWKDDKFKKDLKKATKIKRIDKRPQIVGSVKMSAATCEQLGIKPFEDKKVFDYYRMFQACINLLDRKKLLSRVRRVEKLESIDFDQAYRDAVQQGQIQSKS